MRNYMVSSWGCTSWACQRRQRRSHLVLVLAGIVADRGCHRRDLAKTCSKEDRPGRARKPCAGGEDATSSRPRVDSSSTADATAAGRHRGDLAMLCGEEAGVEAE